MAGNNTMTEAISDCTDFMTRSFQIWHADIITNQPLLAYGKTSSSYMSVT
jgi:hypothetical protein